MIYETILGWLTERGVAFRLHAHEAVRTIDDAEQKAPVLVEKLIKTVAFRVKDGGWVLAGVRSSDRIDYRKLAAVLGVNRRQLRSVSPQEIESELGFEVGGVGPFPVRDDVTVIFDRHLRNAGTIYCGSGKNTQTLELAFEDLVEMTAGEIQAITREANDSP
ncbi:hypothetical protein GF339_11145 [candidate division KSB3 bacterium]|uniref:YbaK/aminoacyl-tRNA synthetase-associated domain-containing protein n=1 Tax=candidate division KSB3 bacterium TaxID=2044937 RepID=A0A9D5JWC8_9BACT|nr:hypothetical protein [candidate division KSB3 bacterium]MBD3325132.1 hypothetical protein [candidate division KSB3 bacterium]